jgi:hypothetical protein
MIRADHSSKAILVGRLREPQYLKGTRRTLLGVGSAYLLAHLSGINSFAQMRTKPSEDFSALPAGAISPTLLSAPLELAGNWGHMIPRSAKLVIERMRHACLDGIRLVSDQQPASLRVEQHSSGPPAVWLHDDESTVAWITVDIGERAWIQLAYQFGHELGHVLANSWQRWAEPKTPCQWLEEAMVEALSLFGLKRLAESWRENPPFPGDHEFSVAIASYLQIIIERYTQLATEQGLLRSPAEWFATNRQDIEVGGLNPFAQAASVAIVAEYERNPGGVEALGTLNRWPDRAGLPIEDYFNRWEASCDELHATRILPTRLREWLLA